VECKSGYGLNTETELRLLQVYRELMVEQPVHLVPTFMGAHTIPDEWKHDREGYLNLVVDEMLPEVAKQQLARFNDVFVEETAIKADEAERVLEAGMKYGLRAKVHADQLTGGHGSELAGRLGAISADHLECITKLGMKALRDSGTIAVSLPIATLYMKQRPLPARELIRQGIPVAVATDFNPGTAPSYHLPYAMHLGCVLQRMTPDEVFKGATLIAARAIGEEAQRGSIHIGKRADFVILDIPDIRHWFYHFRPNVCEQTWIGGEKVWDAREHFLAFGN
jgi:imidazolonepropionase